LPLVLRRACQLQFHPQREQLLQQLFAQASLRIVPPLDSSEKKLSGDLTINQIEQGLLDIATTKADRVAVQLTDANFAALLTADTVVVAPAGTERFHVLGKPDPTQFPKQVRSWFETYYLGRTHQVISAVCVQDATGQRKTAVVTTDVTFAQARTEQVNWYLETGESLGKAGGYAIQGLASLFVSQINGSLSNVIGLPLKETHQLLTELLGTEDQNHK